MKRATLLAVYALLAACSSEPVRPPEVPAPADYTPTPVVPQTVSADVPGGQAQRFAAGGDIPAQWWTLFRSPSLDRLVRAALDNSPTLAKAGARLRQAQEDLSARTGSTQYPRVDAKLSANRVDVHPQSLGVQALPVGMPLNLFLASVSVSYTLDLFGATRNELEALRSETDYQGYEVEAARLMLAGNVVTAAIREASLREQIAGTEEMIALQARSLAIAEQLERIGGAAKADIVAQRLELAQTRAMLPDLQRQLEQVRHRLAVYTGRPPSAAGLPEFRLLELQLPEELPVSLPSELARQRPDIRAAEALLKQAGARVGVATANLYPQITLSATGGSLASGGGDLFAGGTGFYLLGASLTQPLFHGNELQAKRRSAVAAYEQAGAAYQEAVLLGFQNVADTLRALETDAIKLKERADAAAQARSYHDIISSRYEAGGVSFLALLDAQRKLRGARIDRTQAIADRYADSAALLQALGGGWWKDERLKNEDKR
ncbi:MAG TPA: efflux transporter outer membrane subunit [Burkholderiales bacterium]|nr:efflux transporter outer membrane subunit [Burkholderiales bacterium]